MNGDIELRQLRYFLAVAEELHFTRAAERLRIAQPPLSRQIQNLERALGVQLFERTNRKVSLTTAGEAFLEEARSILDSVDRGVSLTQQVAREEIGRLAIGFEGSTAHSWLLKIVRELCAKSPKVELILKEMSSGKQVEAIEERRLDIAAIDPLFLTSNLDSTGLFREPLVVAFPHTHPFAGFEEIELHALQKEAWITGQNDGNCGLLQRILAACEDSGFAPKIRQEASDLQMLMGAVASGLGVTLLPRSTQALTPSNIKFVPLQPPAPEMEMSLVWLKQDSSPLRDAFVETARSLLT